MIMFLISPCKHECAEWDFLEIDIDMPEFSCCTCFDTKSPKTIRDWIAYAYRQGFNNGYDYLDIINNINSSNS